MNILGWKWKAKAMAANIRGGIGATMLRTSSACKLRQWLQTSADGLVLVTKLSNQKRKIGENKNKEKENYWYLFINSTSSHLLYLYWTANFCGGSSAALQTRAAAVISYWTRRSDNAVNYRGWIGVVIATSYSSIRLIKGERENKISNINNINYLLLVYLSISDFDR